MAGGPTIIAQAAPAQLVSFPNWSLPTRVRMVADITGGAAVVRAADTTPGILCSNGAGGVFDITFPQAQRMGDFNPQVMSTVPGTNANRFFGVVDVSTTNTNATTGKLRVVTAVPNAAAAIPDNGAVVDISWYVDYGK